MSGIHGPVYNVRMIHTNEIVNVYTKYGANEFLKQCTNKDDFRLFSSDLKKADAIRKKGRKKKKLNAADRSGLRQIYEKMQAVFQFCDPQEFRQQVPEREIKAWLSHAAVIFQEISKNQQWIRAGGVLEHEETLFASCCFLLQHPIPVVLVLGDDSFFENISSLIVARKEASLHPPVAKWIGITVDQVFACILSRFDNPWEPETAFKKLHATGILEHYIRCTAVKQNDEQAKSIKKFTFRYLLTCVVLVKKRFKAGTPCGDTLRTVLNGNMVVCPFALPYLQSLLKLSNALQASSPRGYEACLYCQKKDRDSTFFNCAKCQQACYCSKECQKGDWQRHKPVCQPAQKMPYKINDALQNLLGDYGEKHFVDIMVKMVEECETEGKRLGKRLGMRDVVLELDFNPDEDGNVPVLQEIPEFKIIPNSKYLKAEVESDMIDKEDIQEFAARLNQRAQTDLICFSVLHEGTKSVCGFHIKYSGVDMYTEEALAAFRLAYVHGDYCHLAHIFPKEDQWKHFAEKLDGLRPTKQS